MVYDLWLGPRNDCLPSLGWVLEYDCWDQPVPTRRMHCQVPEVFTLVIQQSHRQNMGGCTAASGAGMCEHSVEKESPWNSVCEGSVAEAASVWPQHQANWEPAGLWQSRQYPVPDLPRVWGYGIFLGIHKGCLQTVSVRPCAGFAPFLVCLGVFHTAYLPSPRPTAAVPGLRVLE